MPMAQEYIQQRVYFYASLAKLRLK